jgi:ATP-binding protein involved in chromosome partitioning
MLAKRIPDIKHIIAVASGKGGVGKSTTAVNLALALSKDGARVGILDADIYGPSVPMMLGIQSRPEVTPEKKIRPIEAYGLQSMSIGYLIDENTPVVWRGPMVSGALQQLLNDTLWNNLDYLVIDLPPGTGDIQLTLAQKIPVTTAVIVTTPQDLALLDVKRAYEMFQKVNVPVAGIVENMSTHVCSNCGHTEAIFGEGGGQRMGEQYGIPLLGQLPLDIRIREQTDSGKPTVIAEPDSLNAKLYGEIARQVVLNLVAREEIDMTRFPKIVIQND